MKTLFFASAAAAALIAAPAFAQETTGSVGLSYQHTETKFSEYNDLKSEAIAIDGVVATPIFTDWTVTAQAATTYSEGDYMSSETNLSGGVALTKVIGSYRVGGFYSAQETYNTSLSTFGAVAQKYFDRATVSGVASYGTVYDLDIYSVKADVAYYPTTALRLNAGLGYQTIEPNWGSSADTISADIGAEYQIASTPYTVFGAYNYADSNDMRLEENSIKVGVRYNFGGTLQSRERAGTRIDMNSQIRGIYFN